MTISENLKALMSSGLSMEKTDSEPPEYRFSLKGQPKVVRVSLAMVRDKDKVDLIMWGAWDFHPLGDLTKQQWREIVDDWMASGTVPIIDTGGIDLPSRIIVAVKKWFNQTDEGKAYSDMETGSYQKRINKGIECYVFLKEPVTKAVPRLLGHPVKSQDIEFALRRVGLMTGRDVHGIRFGNPSKQERKGFWAVPVERLDSFAEPVVEDESQAELPEDDIPEDF